MRSTKFFKILLLLLAPLLILLPQRNAQALCFSTSGSTNSSVDYTDKSYVANLMAKSDIVAAGVLTLVSDNPWPPTYTLVVEKHWKGDVKNGETLTIRDGMLRGGPCGGIGAKSGQRYVLYLSGEKDSALSVNSYQSTLQSATLRTLSVLHITALGEEWALLGSGLSLVVALVLLLVWLRLKPKSL